MSINALIEELKENNQDFEFYPTTKEMIKCIWLCKRKRRRCNSFKQFFQLPSSRIFQTNLLFHKRK